MEKPKLFDRDNLDKLFQFSEGIIYIIIAVLLIITSALLLFDAFSAVFSYSKNAGVIGWIVPVIDTVLLILMVIEILYTVRVSFKSHTLTPEPFLIIALIAAVRRILVISVESAHLPGDSSGKYIHLMIEMCLLGLLIMIFVGSIVFLRRNMR